MNEAVMLAKRMLASDGEFHPYAFAMKPNGEVVSIAAQIEHENFPASTELIETLTASLREAASEGRYKATAIIYNVTIGAAQDGERTDAIAVALDHKSAYSVIVYHPYISDGGRTSYGKLIASQGSDSIFDSSIN